MKCLLSFWYPKKRRDKVRSILLRPHGEECHRKGGGDTGQLEGGSPLTHKLHKVKLTTLEEALSLLLGEHSSECFHIRFKSCKELVALLQEPVTREATSKPPLTIYTDPSDLGRDFKGTGKIILGGVGSIEVWKSSKEKNKEKPCYAVLKTFKGHTQNGLDEVTCYKRLNPVLKESIPLLLGAWVNEASTVEIVLSHEGVDLESILYHYKLVWEKPLPTELIMEIWSRAMSVLVRFHKMGLTHGDVKLENFVMDAQGTVKIIDLSTVVGVEEQWCHRINSHGLPSGGTLIYMDPLAKKRSIVWPRTWLQALDVYAAGRMLQVMLALYGEDMTTMIPLIERMTRSHPSTRLSLEDALREAQHTHPDGDPSSEQRNTLWNNLLSLIDPDFHDSVYPPMKG